MSDDIIENVSNEFEHQKKGKGRPKKEAGPIANEEKQNITFIRKEVGVGTVKDVPENVTIDALQNRWKDVFRKYESLGYNSILDAYKNGTGANMINNPFIQNSRVKRINTSPMKLNKEDLGKALSDPESNEEVLRGVSYYLYYTNYVYHRLMELNRDTPKYFYYVNPLYIDNVDKKKLRNDSMLLDKCLKKFNVSETFKTIGSQVNLEGKASYIVRTSYDKKDVNYLLLQKLDSNNVKITGFGSKQRYIISFDFSIFLHAGYSVDQYPEYFRDVWEELLTNGIISIDKKGRKKTEITILKAIEI